MKTRSSLNAAVLAVAIVSLSTACDTDPSLSGGSALRGSTSLAGGDAVQQDQQDSPKQAPDDGDQDGGDNGNGDNGNGDNGNGDNGNGDNGNGDNGNGDNGNGDGDNGDGQPQVFTAQLSSLNTSVGPSGGATGTARIEINGDQVTVQVDGQNVAPSAVHVQHVHAGTSCPDQSADTNNDGFVDVIEGVPAYGPILVPLDGDLNSQSAGGEGFPMANEQGTFSYSQTASLETMLADLRAEDPNPEDPIVKLGPNEDLNLGGRHIVIHGVSADTALPDTVATIADIPAAATLPIACGELVQQ